MLPSKKNTRAKLTESTWPSCACSERGSCVRRKNWSTGKNRWPMSGDDAKKAASQMNIDPRSIYEMIRKLLLDGLFDVPVTASVIVDRARERFGKKLKAAHIQTYMRKFMTAGVVHAVKPDKSQANYYVI